MRLVFSRHSWLLPLWVFCWGYLLFSCTSREEREFSALIEHADSIADRNPDSALAILSPLLSSPKGESLAVPTAKLLRVKIDDKLYRPITGYEHLVTDTLLPYFRYHDKKWLPTALFYAGRICADKGDAPQAIDYYQQTLDALPEQGGERFRGLIHSQIGTLFYYQELFDEAIYQYKQAFICQQQGRDTVGMIFDLRDIGNSHLLLEKNDTALEYFKRASTLAIKSNNKNMYIDVMGEIANLYMNMGKYDKAKEHIWPAIEDLDSANISSTYYIISNIYYHLGLQDSAIFYFKELLRHGNVYGKQSAFQHLSEIAYQEKQYQEFKSLYDSLRIYDDSIKKLNNAEVISRMHSLYNYSQYKLTAQELTISNRNLLVIIVSVCFLLVVTILLLIIHSQRSRIREEQLQLRIHQLLSEINRKEPEQEATEEVNIKDTPIYQTINRKLSGEDDSIMKDSEWNELATLLNDNCQGFTRKLKELHPMNESELRVSMLLKVGCSPKQIARLCCITISGVSNIRSRLVEKVLHLSAAPKAWDQFIQKL